MGTGTNNPENTPATATPAGTPAPAGAPAVVDTTIEAGGRRFELRHMSAAEGVQLYSVLPPEFQRTADFYAGLAKSFERVLQIQLPPGMSLDNAWANTVAALQTGRGQLDANAPEYMRQMVAQIPQLARQIPGAGVVEGSYDLAAGTVAAGQMGYNLLAAFPRALRAIRVTGQEAVGALGGGISDDQAKAFGAAYAGAIMYQGATRRAMPFIDSPFNDQSSQFWSNPLQYSMAGLEYASLNWPIVSTVWPYIEAAFTYVTQLLRDTPRRSYSDILQEVQGSAEARRAAGQTSYSALVEARMRDPERERASAQIVAADEIAGVRTAELGVLGDQGGVIVDQNGRTANVNPDGPIPSVTPVAGQNGQGEGRLSRSGAAWGEVFNPLIGIASEHPLAAGIATVAVGSFVIPRAVSATVAGVALTRSVAAMPVAAAATIVNTQEGRALRGAQERVATLLGRQGALTEELAEAQRAQASAGNGLSRWRAGSRVASLETQLTRVGEELNGGGRPGFFSRTVPAGALSELSTAQAAVETRLANPTRLGGPRMQAAERLNGAADRIAGREPAASRLPAAAPTTVASAAAAAPDNAAEISRAARTPGPTAATASGVAAATDAAPTPRGGLFGSLRNYFSGASAAPAAVADAAPAAAAAAPVVAAATSNTSRVAAVTEEVASRSSIFSRIGGFVSSNWSRLTRIPRVGPVLAGGAALVGGGAALLMPASAAARTLGAQDAPEAATNGASTAVLGTTAVAATRTALSSGSGLFSSLRFALGRVSAVAAPVIATGEFVNSAAHGDNRGMVQSGTALGTMGAGAGIGFCVGGPPGAAVGLLVGGIASIFTGWGAGAVYDANSTPAPTVASNVVPVAVAAANSFSGAAGEQRFNAQLAALVGEANVNNARTLFQAGGITQRSGLDADRNGQITEEELRAGYIKVLDQAQRTNNTALARQLAIHVRDVHPGAQIQLADDAANVPALAAPAGAAPSNRRLTFSS